MYVSRNDHLVLNKQLVFSSLETFSSRTSNPYLPIDHCLELKHSELSPLHVSMSVGIILVQVMSKQPCWWDVMGLVSLAFPEDTFLPQTLYFSGLTYSNRAILIKMKPVIFKQTAP